MSNLSPRALALFNAAKRPEAPALVNVRGEVADLNLYGIVGQDFTDKGVADALAGIPESAKSVCLYVNSPGGDYFQGKAIYSQLQRFAANRALSACVDSLAASAAALLIMAAPRIEVAPQATIMIHRVSGMAYGNASDLESQARVMRAEDDTLSAIYAKRTGLDTSRVCEMLAAETYMNAEEAVALHFADAIAKPDEPAAPAAPTNLAGPADDARARVRAFKVRALRAFHGTRPVSMVG